MGYKYLFRLIVTITCKGPKPPSSLSTWARQTKRGYENVLGRSSVDIKGLFSLPEQSPIRNEVGGLIPVRCLWKKRNLLTLSNLFFFFIWAPLTYFPYKQKCQNLISFWVHDKTPQEPSVIWLGQNKFLVRGMICLFFADDNFTWSRL